MLDERFKDNQDILKATEILFSIIGIPYKLIFNVKDKDAEWSPILIYYGLNEKTIEKKNSLIIPVEVRYKFPKEASIVKLKNGASRLNFDIIKLVSDLVIKNQFNLIEGFMTKEGESNDRFHNLFLMQAIKKISDNITNEFYKKKLPLLQKCHWPDGMKFAGCLTHDVDAPFKYNFIGTLIELKKSALSLLNFKLKNSFKIMHGLFEYLITDNDPYFQFEKLMSTENTFGFRSSFYFCSARNHKLDPYYNIAKLKNIIKKLSDSGFEIGLHGSYTSYLDEDRLIAEKKIIEKLISRKIAGGRQHFLNFSYPKTWIAQKRAGLFYDSTLGYNNNIGSINGMYFPFDISILNKDLRMVEIPMIVMDGALFNLKVKDFWQPVRQLCDNIKEFNGLLTVNWHDRVFYDKDFPGWGLIYSNILIYLKDQDAYIATAEKIAEWHTNRNSLKLSYEYLTKGRLIYTLTSKKNIKEMDFYMHTNRNIKIGTQLIHEVINSGNGWVIKLKGIKKDKNYTVTIK